MKLPVLYFGLSESKNLGNYDVMSIPKENDNDFDLYGALRNFRPVVIITTGSSWNAYKSIGKLNHFWRKRWIHFEKVSEITAKSVQHCYNTSIMDKESESNPYISIVTTAYHSGDRILRPFQSLIAQTYTNWEWVVFDDSKNNSTWSMLKSLKAKDYRIRIYRSDENCGFIGNVKRTVSMLGIGKYLVELDHDDELVPDMLRWIVNGFKMYPDAKFLWSDYCETREDTLTDRNYGDQFGRGYGSTYNVKYGNRIHTVIIQPWVNHRTIGHIVGVPNHVRVWDAEFYRELNGHNPGLPVADDYELLLRTFLKAKYIHVAELGYIQYMNTGDNNFTSHRNALIQDLTAEIYKVYKDRIDERLGQLNLAITGDISHRGWTVPNDDLLRCDRELIYKPTSPEITLIYIFDQQCQQVVDMTLAQKYTKWELVIVASNNPDLSKLMETMLPTIDHRVRWWCLNKQSTDDELLQYAKRMLTFTRHYLHILKPFSTPTDLVSPIK